MSFDDQDSRENRDSDSPTAGGPPDSAGSDSGSSESGDDDATETPGAEAPQTGTAAPGGSPEPPTTASDDPGSPASLEDGGSDEPPDDEDGPDQGAAEQPASASEPTKEQDESTPTATYYDDPYDDYEHDYKGPETETTAVAEAKPAAGQAAPPTPPPPSEPEDGFDDDEEGMTRMSFLEHLEELRTRILHSLSGLVVTYGLALVFKNQLFGWMRQPFDRAVENLSPELGVKLVAITPIEQFHLLWLKLPIVAAIFLAAPWLGYQAWAFITPGLYRRERRWAVPFVVATTALFLLGGVFGYFVALRFALEFLLGVGQDVGIESMISVNSYYGTFVSIMLGLGVVFQLPIVIFTLTVLRITSPGFLLQNVRYAILIIFALAAVITPTPDIFNMILFAAPMILLFFVGIGASYLFVLHREDRGLPWARMITILVLVVLVILAVVAYYMHARLGYQFVPDFPWFARP